MKIVKLRLYGYVLIILLSTLVAGGCWPKRIRETLDAPGVQFITEIFDVTLSQPVWSPDGTRLVAVDPGGSVHGSPGALYIIDVVTGSLEQVSYTGQAVEVDGPSWSDMDNKIAYSSSGFNEREAGIYVIDPDNGEEPQFVTGWANNAAVSPTGEQIALWGPLDRLADEREWKLSVLDIYNSKEDIIFRIRADIIHLRGLSWSADGQNIAFAMKVIETSPECHFNGSSSDINCSSDDKSSEVRLWYNIYTIDADGSNLKQITNNTDVDSMSATWSPDGRYIAYVQGTEFRGGYLWVMKADGSCAAQLLEVVGINTPAWSPDGTHIAFDYDWGLYLLDLNNPHFVERVRDLDCN